MPSDTRYQWNPNAARYFDTRSGRFVSRDLVRKSLDRVVDAESLEMRVLAGRLRDQSIDLAEWQAGMREAIKSSALDAAYAAVGGRAQMTQSDYGYVGAFVREQYGYLARFTQQIRDGLPLDGRFLVRAAMYPQAARTAFHELQKDVLDEAGYTQERSILHPAEHCEQCVDQASLGKVPIGTCVPIGQRECLTNCHCTMRYYP